MSLADTKQPTKAERKPHLSPTQLEMYAKCPEQYRRRYIKGERIPPGIAMHVGSGTHVGIEHNFSQKIETHEDLPAAEIVEAAVAGFDARIHGDGLLLTDDETSRGSAVVIGAGKDQVAALAELHATDQAPEYQPVTVEHSTRIVFHNASHDLLGITDLRDDKGRVVDFKTAARKKPQADADSSLALTVYAAAYMIELCELPAELRLDVLTKTKTPARQMLTTKRSQRDFGVLVARVNAVTEAISKGSFPPALPGAWWCSTKFCGYARSCPYYNPERDP